VQVCVLDYRPAYQRLHLVRPTFEEMRRVRELLRGLELKSVVCQTGRGRIGPEGSLLWVVWIKIPTVKIIPSHPVGELAKIFAEISPPGA
jgi:hypothetical protein